MDNVDLEFEKLIFLFCAEEPEVAIYELIWELEKGYGLPIEENFKIAKEILHQLLDEKLIVLSQYADNEFTSLIMRIKDSKESKILNQISAWLPFYYAKFYIEITEKGSIYYSEKSAPHGERLNKRLFNR